MARIRTIKPEFFTSEDIVALTPFARLLYIALWCEADREGRFAWKPATFKMRYLPADDVNIRDLCQEIVDQGLVVLYRENGSEIIDNGTDNDKNSHSDNGSDLFDNEIEKKSRNIDKSLDTLAYIPKFSRHQQINNRETPSVLPEPLSMARVDDASRREKHAPRGEGKGKERNANTRVTTSRDVDFEKFWSIYPRKDSKVQAEKAFTKIAPNEQLLAKILAGVQRAVTSEQWCKDEGRFIPYASTWLNGKRWEDGGASMPAGQSTSFNGHSADNPFA
ncbi:hypothetical protein SY91_01753 [Burkholderia cenocepacia]|uniref:hypothetical protein n=1 Tax=Burkholderia cenocepacia TaxID=95486 RepID=UPI00163BB2FA|nr:hypothetical protein [Burkholderia cenocepacia]QND94354.1 hypothetical protein SY91_01753 [Burkholderia cenocepacia]